MMKSLLRFFVCTFLTSSFLFGQAPPLAVPFIDQASPASLTPGATTLTLTGANFNQNAIVALSGPGVGSTQSTSTTVNSSGTQIVASFFSSPVTSTEGTLRVTVTNPSGEVSNAVYLSVTAPTATVNVRSNSSFSFSGIPTAVVAGDFNGDGILDLAIANQSAGSVSILLGNTNGTLYTGNTYPVGSGPAGVASGDFNGDGKVDLVVANAQDETLTILLGNGDGTFTVNPSTPATGAYPASIVAADFNGDGKLDLGTATVSGNSAQILVSTLAAGTHSIQATYSGDTNFGGSTSRLSQTVNQATTTLSLSSSLSTSSYSQAVTLTATVQPSYTGGSATGTVSFYDNGTLWQTAPVLNNVAQISVTGFALGTHSLTATYGGDSDFTGSSATAISLVVSQAATTVTLVSNANPSVYGQAVTYTATVGLSFNGSTPSGAITFYDGTTVLWSGYLSKGSAQFTVSSATAGSHSITAQYGGTANFTASTSPVLTQTVNQCPTTLTVSSNANPSSYGQSVTLYATLQTNYDLLSNGGTVTLSDNGTQLGTATIQGSNTVSITTTSLGVGARTITATYGGDSNLLASNGTLAQTVNPAATTTTIASTSYTPAFGQSITLTANVRPTYGNTPTGTITFMDRTTSLGTVPLANNIASFSISTLSAGTHYISAQYSGDTYSAASSSAQTLVTVSPPPATTVLTSSVNPSSYNQAVTLTATLQLTSSGIPTGTVTFYDGSTSIGTSAVANSAAQLTISGFQLGTHSLTATYSGDSNFSGSTSTAVSQAVNAAPTTTTVTSLDNPGTAGYNVRFLVGTTATFGGGPAGNVTLYDGTTAVGSGILPGSTTNNWVEIVVSGLAAGSHSITAKYAGSVYYTASTSSPLTEVMNLPATTTYLSAGTNPVAFGQSLALVATVQPPGSGSATGTVTFLDGTTTLATVTLANNLAQLNVSTLSVGSHTLTAKYSGDSNFAGSTSATVTETVNQAATTTTITSSATPSAYSQSVTFSASLAPNYGGTATGTFTFLDGTTSIGTVAVSNNAAHNMYPITYRPSLAAILSSWSQTVVPTT